MYREFLRDFEREIKRPEVEIDYSDDLVEFMRFLQPMEYAEPLLTNPARRAEAFGMLREGVKFSSYIWGRKYEELGAADPSDLFYKLGYREDKTQSIGIFGKASLASSLISLMLTTINKESVLYLNDEPDSRSVMRWTYESIFFDDLPFNRIPPIRFPTHLPTCPPRNEDNMDEVWSGREIPVTGIWEPWAIDPKIGVRCPNYYLAGDIASQYQIEGTDTLEDVRWRLIWKDLRYPSGQTPVEEDDYFAPAPSANLNAPVVRQARPGEVCPESGEWYAPHLNNRTFRMSTGEIMPGPEFASTGAVIWYLKPRPDSGSTL
ncbi:Immunity protein 72 [Paraburkholderia lycopersici]|uniref:Immunity protein 72 n=1 Tax=Paraburkholderia lycopersici TaxID=416944 RepID=A0A1G6H7N2_9BURK|nr:Immunity protein 72 [Paraburkholderia lycopersici]